MTERAKRAAEHRNAKRVLVPEDCKLPKLKRHDWKYKVWLDPIKSKRPLWMLTFMRNREPWCVGKYRTERAAKQALQAFQRPNTYWSDVYIARIEKI